MKKKALAVLIILIVLIILAVINIIWKFSMGDFSDMPLFRRINVVASIIVIVSGGVGICGFIYMANKGKFR